MPTFAYTARDPQGTETRGRLEAATRRAALAQLQARRLVPVRLSEADAGSAAAREPGGGVKSWFESLLGEATPRRARVARRHALPFLRTLAGLVGSGIQTADGVRLLSRRVSDPALRTLAAALWDDLAQGKSLSAAMQRHPAVFEDAIVHLVEAGEATGNLGVVLERLVSDIEARDENRSQLLQALAYPVFIMVVALGVLAFFLFFLMPRLEQLFANLRGKMPLATQLLIGTADFIVRYGPVFLVLAAAAAFALWAWRRQPAGRVATDGWLLKLTGIGTFVINNEVLRMAQTLGLLLENGVSTLPALAMTERTLQNRVIRARFAEARAKIAEGAAISTALKATGYFPDLVIDVLTVGENTGDIVPSLKEVAKVFRRTIERQVSVFLRVVSVAVLLVAFAFVVLVTLGIVLAVLQASASLRV
jgi:general secretion pathway protein F